MLLNGGYGLIELVAGFAGDSQAQKADALDFLGDGAISLLGLLAMQWTPCWRAKAALMQGSFLGVLGIGVLTLTIYRPFEPGDPDASVMGFVRYWSAGGQSGRRVRAPAAPNGRRPHASSLAFLSERCSGQRSGCDCGIGCRGLERPLARPFGRLRDLSALPGILAKHHQGLDQRTAIRDWRVVKHRDWWAVSF